MAPAHSAGCSTSSSFDASAFRSTKRAPRLRVRRALLRHAGESGAVPSARYARVLAKVGA
jgi:hypothetical protein